MDDPEWFAGQQEHIVRTPVSECISDEWSGRGGVRLSWFRVGTTDCNPVTSGMSAHLRDS